MGLFTAVIVGILVLSTTKVLATEDEEDSQLACHCSPVINVSVDGDGRCDLCKSTSQLRKELKELKSELLTVKNQLGRIQPGSHCRLLRQPASNVALLSCRFGLAQIQESSIVDLEADPATYILVRVKRYNFPIMLTLENGL